jgi:hypothetical protein
MYVSKARSVKCGLYSTPGLTPTLEALALVAPQIQKKHFQTRTSFWPMLLFVVLCWFFVVLCRRFAIEQDCFFLIVGKFC